MFCTVPHGGRQMFLPVDPKHLRAPTSLSRPKSLRLHVPKNTKTKGCPRGNLHSDAQVSIRARKHQTV